MSDDLADSALQTHFQAEAALLATVRVSLVDDQPLCIPDALPLPFSTAISQVYITLFQRGLKPLRWGAKKATLQKTLQRIIERLQANPALASFAINDYTQCRILFEMVTDERPCNIQALTGQTLTENRFEPGITGIRRAELLYADGCIRAQHYERSTAVKFSCQKNRCRDASRQYHRTGAIDV